MLIFKRKPISGKELYAVTDIVESREEFKLAESTMRGFGRTLSIHQQHKISQ